MKLVVRFWVNCDSIKKFPLWFYCLKLIQVSIQRLHRYVQLRADLLRLLCSIKAKENGHNERTHEHTYLLCNSVHCHYQCKGVWLRVERTKRIYCVIRVIVISIAKGGWLRVCTVCAWVCVWLRAVLLRSQYQNKKKNIDTRTNNETHECNV